MARDIAAESIVLLKNEALPDGTTPILPLAAGTRVALVGDFAETPRYQGAGSSLVNPTSLDTLRGCIDESDLSLVGYEPGFERHGGENAAKAAAAIEIAKQADVVLVCMGLDEQAESEVLTVFPCASIAIRSMCSTSLPRSTRTLS